LPFLERPEAMVPDRLLLQLRHLTDLHVEALAGLPKQALLLLHDVYPESWVPTIQQHGMHPEPSALMPPSATPQGPALSMDIFAAQTPSEASPERALELPDSQANKDISTALTSRLIHLHPRYLARHGPSLALQNMRVTMEADRHAEEERQAEADREAAAAREAAEHKAFLESQRVQLRHAHTESQHEGKEAQLDEALEAEQLARARLEEAEAERQELEGRGPQEGSLEADGPQEGSLEDLMAAWGDSLVELGGYGSLEAPSAAPVEPIAELLACFDTADEMEAGMAPRFDVVEQVQIYNEQTPIEGLSEKVLQIIDAVEAHPKTTLDREVFKQLCLQHL